MSASNWAKDCGVCHVGGGQMEYDRDMKNYGDPSSADAGSAYTYRPNLIAGDGSIIPRGNRIHFDQLTNELYGDNKAEVDCMMCHMDGLRTGAAWYISQGCSPSNPIGPADDPTCTGTQFAGVDTNTGKFYDSFNRNIAVSIGFFKQSASAGIGALIDLSTVLFQACHHQIPGTR